MVWIVDEHTCQVAKYWTQISLKAWYQRISVFAKMFCVHVGYTSNTQPGNLQLWLSLHFLIAQRLKISQRGEPRVL